MAREMAFYGKGGVGKSTIACNLSAVLAESGYKVMQVGCNPKIDSTALLLGGEPSDVNVLEHTRNHGPDEATVRQTIVKGYKGVLCVESGGPEPAEGCAGRGVNLALDLLKRYGIYDKMQVQFVIYDVIADVVCGGFAQPMRAGYAREVYLVTSGELMSLYSANNICKAICTIAASGADVRVAGIVNNMRNVQNEQALVSEFSESIGVPVMAHIPRHPIVQEGESRGATVVEAFPTSPQATAYRTLAKQILENENRYMPTPLELEDIIGLLRKYKVAA